MLFLLSAGVLSALPLLWLAPEVAAAGSSSATAAHRAVNVALKTSWSASHPVFELLEQTHLHDPSAFPALLAAISKIPSLDTLSPEALLDSTVPLLPIHPAALPTWYLGIAAKETAPIVEAHLSLHDEEVDAASEEGLEECGAWLDWQGRRGCGVDGALLVLGLQNGGDDIRWANESFTVSPQIYSFDHLIPASSPSSIPADRPAILYFHPTSNLFAPLLEFVQSFSELPLLIRYRSDPRSSTTTNSSGWGHLSAVHPLGWGVEMVLKKMEYSSVDDRSVGATERDDITDDKAQEPIASASPFLDSLGPTLWEATPSELTEAEISAIPLHASGLILNHTSPLRALEAISQDFPLYVNALGRLEDPDQILRGPKGPELEAKIREIWENRRVWDSLGGSQSIARPGALGKKEGRLWIGSREVNDNEMDVFDLIPLVRNSLHNMVALTELGFTPAQAHTLLTLEPLPVDLFDGLVDASDRLEGGDTILWWNDIEKDARYASFPKSWNALLRQTQPGALPPMRKNVFNVILSLDLGTVEDIQVLVQQVQQLVQRGLTVRFGIVPVMEGEGRHPGMSIKMARVMHYLIDRWGRTEALRYFMRLIQRSPTSDIPLEMAHEFYNHVVEHSPRLPDPEGFRKDEEIRDFYSVTNQRVPGYEDRLAAYQERMDILGVAAGKIMFVNGKAFERDENWLRVLQGELTLQIQYLAKQVYTGALADSEQDPADGSTYFYDLPQAFPRRNGVIFEASGGEARLEAANLVKLFADMPEGSSLGHDWIYTDSLVRPKVSVILIVDLDSRLGSELVSAALASMATSSFRLSFIHAPSPESSTASPGLFSVAVHHHIHGGVEGPAEPTTLASILERAGFNRSAPSSIEHTGDYIQAQAFWKSGQLIVERLGVEPGEATIVINGRVVRVNPTRGFSVADFNALFAHELLLRVDPVAKAIDSFYNDSHVFDRETYSNLVTVASSIILHAIQSDQPTNIFGMTSTSNRNNYYNLFKGEQTSFNMGHNATALLRFHVVLDPLTETAQRWSTVLKVLADLDFVHIHVVLLPAVNMEEIPLKRFYRVALDSRLRFDETGYEIIPRARFSNLPQEPIFTLGVDTPSSWLVIPRASIHDLDNLRLSELPSDVEPVFEIEHLIVEGYARETVTSAPPRGLQLQLNTLSGDPTADTSVMSNLGYFQLKTTPGVHHLSIREGRGRDIYELESVGAQGWDSPACTKTGAATFSVQSFSGLTLYPRFLRKPGMEKEDVLETLRPPPPSFLLNVYSKVMSLFVRKEQAPMVVPTKRNADINIFTVASGLLYERFASIMAVSVMRHTNSTVKFWFIENFLSPSFLEFIPHLANEYGFEYELVTYKWPSWLIHQKEKQRTIWGYKILFLDVLFPMDLDKVIFVDADQIVRTDLQELVDEDLYGAAYGYAPMGNDREEMEGFRFWKTGYWKESLRGRPYHISALYVVDLLRFRQIAAGDRLRAQYQGLAQDPNSLANLDQDLPNSMQDQLRIHTLDRSWLWCATWCSQESLAEAKTIDLCQDPLTKEPKLDRARKIPEWEVYDAEVAALASRLSRDKIIKAAAIEVADLAAGVVVPREGDEIRKGEEEMPSLRPKDEF